MTQTFEMIEVQTSALREAYEPTMLQLQSLLLLADDHMKNIKKYTYDLRQSFISKWHQELEQHQKSLEELQIYNQKMDSFWNILLRKKFTRPVVTPMPVLVDNRKWDSLYEHQNKVRYLFEECFEALLPCNYSDKVKMTAEQLQRVEYFRSGKALKDALEWLDTKPEQF